MNRKQKRALFNKNGKRIRQLLNSKVVNSDRFKGMDKEEIKLLQEGKHSDRELQDFFNLQKKLVLELDQLLQRK